MTRDRRRGFTLIELLVVIGVILLLIGIAVLAYQKLDKIAGDNATKTRLATCAAILSEYETVATLNAIESPSGIFSFTGGNPPLIPPNIPRAINANDVGNVSVGSGTRTAGVGVTAFNVKWVVYNTAGVFQTITQVPSVKTMVGQFPGNVMLTVPTGTNGQAATWVDPNMPPGSLFPGPLPVVLDAWKNPIIYVPSGGMTNVVIGRPTSTATQTNIPGGKTVVVRSVDGRPFWASAGQDGNFTFGDDNLYSCAVVYSAK